MKALAVSCLMVLAAAPVLAASDPDWPCQAPRRADLSIGQMWAGPPPDEASAKAATRPEMQALAARLASRKIPLDTLTPDLAAFAASADASAMTGLFQTAFDALESRRRLIVARIDDFTRSQRKLGTEIEAQRARMAKLEAAASPDFDAIDAAEEQLDIATRMFRERQEQVRYVCDVPNLIEQRAFAVSRAIAAQMK